MAKGIVVLVCLGLLSCVHASSSAYATSPTVFPSDAPVRLSATRDPIGARELGVAEAHGRMTLVTLEALISEFRSRVASLGGNYGRIDRLATKDELVEESYSYECGSTETELESRTVTRMNPDGSMTSTTETVPVTKYVSRTCTGTQEVEVVTLTVVGRAFRTVGEER